MNDFCLKQWIENGFLINGERRKNVRKLGQKLFEEKMLVTTKFEHLKVRQRGSPDCARRGEKCIKWVEYTL